MTDWVPLNRSASPTKAATDISLALPGAINLGQGREVDQPGGEIGKLLRGEIQVSPKYNSSVGGPMAVREAAAEWTRRFIGIEAAKKENTFVMQTLGREGLNQAFALAAHKLRKQGIPGRILVPCTSWPVITELADDQGLEPVIFDISKEKLTGEIYSTMAKIHADYSIHRHIAAYYQNSPHNASGRHITAEENRLICKSLSSSRPRMPISPVTDIHDNPYFMACAANDSGSGAYLRSGYEGNVLAEDAPRPWIHIMSGSKALATANTGLTVVVTHPDIAPAFAARLIRTTGLSYNDAYMANLGEVFKPAHDAETCAHFSLLRTKYATNRDLLEDQFRDAVIPGGVNMTSLKKVPEGVLGREVTCHDGKKRAVRDVNDFVEMLANGGDDAAQGVVVVNNGKDMQGHKLIRIAQAQHPETFAEGLARIRRVEHLILNSPALAP